MEKRWNEIKQYWQKHSPSWLFLGLAFGLIIGFGLGFLTGSYGRFIWENESIAGFIQNFWPEALGIVLTVGLIERFNKFNEDKRLKLEKKERLIRQVSSRDNALAIDALKELSAYGWLSKDSDTLSGQDFFQANLEGSILNKVNLSNSHLGGANLRAVQLVEADLSKARLYSATLEYSWLYGANFTQANLHDTNLCSTEMGMANFSGADLTRAIMVGSKLTVQHAHQQSGGHITTQSAIFDNRTILPDGTTYIPELGLEQMKRFGCIIEPDQN